MKQVATQQNEIDGQALGQLKYLFESFERVILPNVVLFPDTLPDGKTHIKDEHRTGTKREGHGREDLPGGYRWRSRS